MCKTANSIGLTNLNWVFANTQKLGASTSVLAILFAIFQTSFDEFLKTHKIHMKKYVHLCDSSV